MTRQLDDELMLLYTMRGNKLEDFILVGNCTTGKVISCFLPAAKLGLRVNALLTPLIVRRSFETKLQDSLGFNECDLSCIWNIQLDVCDLVLSRASFE